MIYLFMLLFFYAQAIIPMAFLYRPVSGVGKYYIILSLLFGSCYSLELHLIILKRVTLKLMIIGDHQDIM